MNTFGEINDGQFCGRAGLLADTFVWPEVEKVDQVWYPCCLIYCKKSFIDDGPDHAWNRAFFLFIICHMSSLLVASGGKKEHFHDNKMKGGVCGCKFIHYQQ